ncbi:uncharacterized protein [Rutidosis leptorrhynchoides]|uniref:uncharacterized protein n=1 Tax=Rutidosis leptorrhynchoides TaxID=125765 RepID=UPI003A992D4A
MEDAADFSPLAMLNDSRRNWRVRVKVFVNWRKTYFNNPYSAMSLELILIDNLGNKIRATVTRNNIHVFKNILREDSFIELSNFGVVRCDGKVMLLPHEWKMLIYRTTTVVPCAPFEPATDGFNPVPFQQIIEWKLNASHLFDIVGRLVEMEPLRVKREKAVDTKSIEFVLSDNSGLCINCALWAQHATKLFEYASAHKNDEAPIVVMIHNCKVRDWQGFPQVSNQLWGCRLFVNEDVTRIRTYKAEFDIASENSTNCVKPLAHIQIATVVQTAVAMFSKHEPKTIIEVINSKQVMSCIVRGRVQKINDDEGWFINICMKCNKKVNSRLCVETKEKSFECEMCGVTTDVFPRIRTTIRVADDSGECTLVLFDSQLSKMIKKSVGWLREKAQQCDTPLQPPTEFNEILMNPYVFHIKVTDFNIRFNYFGFTVESVTDDKDVFKCIDDKLKGEVTDDYQLATRTPLIAPTQNTSTVKTVHQSCAPAKLSNQLDCEMKLWTKRAPVFCKDLQTFCQVNKYVVKGKVIVIDEDEGWLSLICKQCNKYAGPKFGQNFSSRQYECDNCGPVTEVIPRFYRLHYT